VKHPETIRPPFSWTFIASLCVGLFVFPFVLALIFQGTGGLKALGVALMLLSIPIGFRVALTNLGVHAEGLVRRGPFWGRRARWDEIDSLEIYRDPWLGVWAIGNVRLKSGRSWRLGLIGFGRRGRERLQATLAELRAYQGRHPYQ